ncbi:MAG: hypothetical protein ABIJ42_09350 [Acidobacteriota bacterium]
MHNPVFGDMGKLGKDLPISALLVLTLFIFSCATNPVTGKRQIMLMSEAQEVQLGQLALLNNIELTDKVQAGKLIKIVGA